MSTTAVLFSLVGVSVYRDYYEEKLLKGKIVNFLINAKILDYLLLLWYY